MKKNNFKSTIDWYDLHASEYADKVKSKINLDELKKFLSYLPKNPDILDAGCAAGRDSKILQEFGCKVIGIDLSKELIKIARKSSPNIEFIEADILNLPFEDQSFNGVWASSSLLHFETKAQFKQSLEELYRVVKKNGVLYFCVQGRLADIDSGWVKDEHSQEGRFFQFFKMQEVLEFIDESSFEVIEYFRRESSRHGINWSVVYAKKK